MKLDVNKLKDEYKEKLRSMFYDQVMEGNMAYLTYGIEPFHIQSQTNRDIVKEVEETVKKNGD